MKTQRRPTTILVALSIALVAVGCGATGGSGGGGGEPSSSSVSETPASLHIHYTKEATWGLPPREEGGLRYIPIEPDGTRTELSQTEQGLASDASRLWETGRTLDVVMDGGSAHLRSRVRDAASQWTEYANLILSFGTNAANAEIHVTFTDGDGSWSYIGRDSLGADPSMNLDLDDETTDQVVWSTVLHEFGHALGMQHEHQSPASGINWDREKVLEDMALVGWDAAKVEHNIFDKLGESSTNFSAFDPDSIMIYPIPEEWTTDDFSVAENFDLSAMDKEFAARWYPEPSAVRGQLRTGDDCDAIEFQILPGAVPPEIVRFQLSQGEGITWWKSISVPTDDSYTEVQVEDGDIAANGIAASRLDASRQVKFAKAKALGVHTELGYTWDVLPALAGGDLVLLTWIRDRC
jgi:serralysin